MHSRAHTETEATEKHVHVQQPYIYVSMSHLLAYITQISLRRKSECTECIELKMNLHVDSLFSQDPVRSAVIDSCIHVQENGGEQMNKNVRIQRTFTS